MRRPVPVKQINHSLPFSRNGKIARVAARASPGRPQRASGQPGRVAAMPDRPRRGNGRLRCPDFHSPKVPASSPRFHSHFLEALIGYVPVGVRKSDGRCNLIADLASLTFGTADPHTTPRISAYAVPEGILVDISLAPPMISALHFCLGPNVPQLGYFDFRQELLATGHISALPLPSAFCRGLSAIPLRAGRSRL